MSRVDVFAVMDKALNSRDVRIVWPGESIAELANARAAVAELVEAARQASATLGHAYHTTLTGRLAEYAHSDYQRLDAALAKFGGAA